MKYFEFETENAGITALFHRGHAVAHPEQFLAEGIAAHENSPKKASHA